MTTPLRRRSLHEDVPQRRVGFHDSSEGGNDDWLGELTTTGIAVLRRDEDIGPDAQAVVEVPQALDEACQTRYQQ
jgi:hypothetical protein